MQCQNAKKGYVIYILILYKKVFATVKKDKIGLWVQFNQVSSKGDFQHQRKIDIYRLTSLSAREMAMIAAASITHERGFHINPKNLRILYSWKGNDPTTNQEEVGNLTNNETEFLEGDKKDYN